MMESVLKYDGFLPPPPSPAEASASAAAAVAVAGDAQSLYRVPANLFAGSTFSEQYIVLMVDISGSMDEHMKTLKAAILSTVQLVLERQIASLDQIALIPFDSVAEIHREFQNYDHFKTIVGKLHSRACTNYEKPLTYLKELLLEHGRVTAVMFSDGEPNTGDYRQAMDVLKKIAESESLLVHAIGLNVYSQAEGILRELTAIGSKDGYYQGIGDTEIYESMCVLVDHFDCSVETFVTGHRTRNRFFVGDATKGTFDIQHKDDKLCLNVVEHGIDQLLEEGAIQEILDAFTFMLEYYLKGVESFERVTSIVEHISSNNAKVEETIKKVQQNKLKELCDVKATQLNTLGTTGADNLKRRSEIIAEYNRQVLPILPLYADYRKGVHKIKELCASMKEILCKNRDISVGGELMATVSKFRDEAIAGERQKIARFSDKIRDSNRHFENIDELLQKELDHLLTTDTISTPKFFEQYSDPLSLNNFQEIMLSKSGVFMLLVNVERHTYGIAAPHRTKIVEVGGYSASVLDVMAAGDHNAIGKSLIFDFRGIGFGNAAVPLWISEQHWNKARHLFGPFVGHAVTGNEMEYTNTQGTTLLALIILHLRQQNASEYNTELTRMVSETLVALLDRKKLQNVLCKLTNEFETLNENQIPSIDVFLVYLEFSGFALSKDKAMLLLAEAYRRRNKHDIENEFTELKNASTCQGRRIKKCPLIMRIYPLVFDRYCGIPETRILAVPTNKSNLESYFTTLYYEKQDDLLKSFDRFAKTKTAKLLSKFHDPLTEAEQRAIALSVHKCICFKWDSVEEVPAGYQFDDEFTNSLMALCKRRIGKGEEKYRDKEGEVKLLELLQESNEANAEKFMKTVGQDSHCWGALLDILLRPCKLKRSHKISKENWTLLNVEEYKKQMETMSIPLHRKLVMYMVFRSFQPEDWIPAKVVWRPNLKRRRIIKLMFPETCDI